MQVIHFLLGLYVLVVRAYVGITFQYFKISLQRFYSYVACQVPSYSSVFNVSYPWHVILPIITKCKVHSSRCLSSNVVVLSNVMKLPVNMMVSPLLI